MKDFYVKLDDDLDIRKSQSELLEKLAIKQGLNRLRCDENGAYFKICSSGDFFAFVNLDLTYQSGCDYTFTQALEELSRPHYKVGDWVCVADKPSISDKHRPGTILRIKKFTEGAMEGAKETTTYVQLSDYTYESVEDIRHATTKEKEKAQKKDIKLGIHTVEFFPNSIKVGCMECAIKEWEDLLEIMNAFDLKKVQHVDGTLATFDEIQKILERAK